jgi:ribosomal RNA-processing protein 17
VSQNRRFFDRHCLINDSPVGLSSKAPTDEHEEEYSDEEQLATVAVIEDFDPVADMHGVQVGRYHVGGEDEGDEVVRPLSKDKGRTTITKKIKPRTTQKHKTPARKIRYESKAAARAAHSKALAQRRKGKEKRVDGVRSKRKSNSRR